MPSLRLGVALRSNVLVRPLLQQLEHTHSLLFKNERVTRNLYLKNERLSHYIERASKAFGASAPGDTLAGTLESGATTYIERALNRLGCIRRHSGAEAQKACDARSV